MQYLFWAIELLLLGTPTLFPTLPPIIGYALYALAAVALAGFGVHWSRQKGWLVAPLRAGDLVTLLAVRDHAQRCGWQFGGGSLELLDFKRALDEAGVRGLLTFYARENSDNTFQLSDRPRRPVPKDAWDNLCVSPDGLIDIQETDNVRTALLKKRDSFGDKRYSDVHFLPKEINRWLRVHAPEFRGQHQREDGGR